MTAEQRRAELKQYAAILALLTADMPVPVKDTFYTADMEGAAIYLADFGYTFQSGRKFFKSVEAAAAHNTRQIGGDDYIEVRPCGTGYSFTVTIGYIKR